MAAQFAAVAVARILAEADVADDDHVGNGLFDGLHGTLDRAFRIPGTGTDVVFIGRKTEDFDGRKAELTDVFG